MVKTEGELVRHFQAGTARHTVVFIVCTFVSLTSTSKVFCCSETCRAISFISTFLSLVLQTTFFISQCLRASLYHSKKYYSAPRSVRGLCNYHTLYRGERTFSFIFSWFQYENLQVNRSSHCSYLIPGNNRKENHKYLAYFSVEFLMDF